MEKFRVNTIYICVIFSPRHANSTPRQSAHQIKGGHSASSPCADGWAYRKDECADRETPEASGQRGRVLGRRSNLKRYEGKAVSPGTAHASVDLYQLHLGNPARWMGRFLNTVDLCHVCIWYESPQTAFVKEER